MIGQKQKKQKEKTGLQEDRSALWQESTTEVVSWIICYGVNLIFFTDINSAL